jgi:hypothetical protein
MTSPSFAAPVRFAAIVCAVLVTLVCGFFAEIQAAQSPLLFTTSTVDANGHPRAIALESVTMRAEPFSLSSEQNFSPNDPRTRITLFCMNLDLLAGEGANALTADAEDAAHVRYPLTAEYVGQVPGFEGIYMVILRLNDSMAPNLGDVLIRLNLHGMTSNRVRLAIGQIGGGPADDPGTVPTPAPQTPPPPAPAATPNPFTDSTFAAGEDGLRFLEQATFGPTDAELAHLRNPALGGYRGWLNEQFNATMSNYPSLPLMQIDSNTGCPSGSAATCFRDNYSMYPMQVAFYQRAMNTQVGNDQLRQRVSWALSQIMVVSGQSVQQASWMGYYQQKLDQNAFGNFRQLLTDVTVHPTMGDYLDMVNNRNTLTSPANENYAREVMQLFSIGLDLLNNDGTPKLDAAGNRIPTYDQNNVTNLARVFTGWVFAAAPGQGIVNYKDPMVVREQNHDVGSKTLLNGTVLPAGQNTQTDLNMALDNLFNHPNVGPFIGKQLIQHLVTSNPSPAYVGRVATAFNNNCLGLYPENNCSGARGDMKAVITAILLDPEARGDVKTDPNYGHLKEPALFITNMLRPYVTATDGSLNRQTSSLGQNVFNSPTVFNYYPSDYAIPGTSLYGPSFGILTTTTALGRANLVNTLFVSNGGNGINPSQPDAPTGTQINLAPLDALADNPGALADELNRMLLHNQSATWAASPMRASVITAINSIAASNPITSAQRRQRAQTAIYLVASSSQFQVSR